MINPNNMLKVILIILFILNTHLLNGQNKIKVNPIFDATCFDSISLAKLEEAVIVLENVFNSEIFAHRVMSTKFEVGNHKLSSANILEVISTGMDNYIGKPKDYSIDLRVTIFDAPFGRTNFGVTDMTTRETRTHRCFIINNDTKCYISHLAHEYMHQIGFLDKKSWKGIRRVKTNSVPYKIGNLIDNLIDNDKGCYAVKRTCKK